MEHENDSDTNCKTVCLDRSPRGLEEFEIGVCAETIQTTALLRAANNREELRRVAVTPSPVKDL